MAVTPKTRTTKKDGDKLANTDKQIVLGLDVPKTVTQINADIKKLQKQLKHIKATGALDTGPTVKQINAQIAALQSQLKTIDLKTNVNTSEAQKTGQKLGQTIADSVQKTINGSESGLDTLINQSSAVDNVTDLSTLRSDTEMRSMGKSGNSLFQSLAEVAKELTSQISAKDIVTKAITAARKAISTVSDLDTALVNLRKTAPMSAGELKDFYQSANDTAKQMGVTTQTIIEQAAAWSRLGFNTADAAAKMAKLSSQFRLISPGMSSDEAVSGLVSTMKAYNIEVDDVLDGIMSKINIAGNNFALSNADIVAMLQDSVSAMAEGNNTLEETIALETAAFEIAQDRSVGNDFKTVALRLRGINEETQELDDSLKTIKGDLYDLTGVSIMKDADTYKSTYQILKEMSEVWDSLTSNAQSEALELMFGKLRANIGASVLKNFSTAEKAMDAMANSAGNAEAELSVAMDSIDYKLNKVKETGTGIAQNLFAREDIKSVLDVIGSLGNGLDWITEKLGLFGSLAAGAGLFAGLKNVGSPKMFGL